MRQGQFNVKTSTVPYAVCGCDRPVFSPPLAAVFMFVSTDCGPNLKRKAVIWPMEHNVDVDGFMITRNAW